MSRRLDGRNLLAYMGVKPSTPTQMVVNKDRRPTSTDFQNFQLGTWWIIPTRGSAPTNEVWILINKTATAATWIEVDHSGGAVIPGNQYTLLTADGAGGYGSNVGPGTAGQILVSGGGSANPDYITATAVSPLSVTANASTLEYSLSISDHALIVGDGASGVTEIAPSATAGQPLVSVGASADPAYGTAVVAGGGTGVVTMTTAYAPVCAGTTATGALQVASTGMSNIGWVLTSTGSSSLPTWQAIGATTGFSSVIVRKFTSDDTYSPTGGMDYCIVELVGGGGAGGGFVYSTASPYNSSGGGGGGYARIVLDAATVGASQSVTIGAGGTGTTGSGPAGGNSAFGAILTSNGGSGGSGGTAEVYSGGAGGTASGGDINIPGKQGQSVYKISTAVVQGGAGGNSIEGMGGGQLVDSSGSEDGLPGTGYGSGGGGANRQSGTSSQSGGNGSSGICIITEFIS